MDQPSRGFGVDKPVGMFDRDHEWEALGRFLDDEQSGATLGVVSGRRRQGKTFLLEAACVARGGFYFGATEATNAESLRRIGAKLGEYLKAPGPLHFRNWGEVLDALLGLGRQGPVPVVIDEFPYLASGNHELPSIVQDAYRPLRAARTESQTRLLLCGSAMSFMGGLLSGNAPLRGRAGLELVVHPLDYRLAAEFWGISDPGLAFRVHSIVGGTPAYRQEFARGDVPENAADFDSWVQRTVLNPETPLFREPRYLLAEEPALRDTALYSSVLAAVAEGNVTRGGIANYLDRKATDIAHPLAILEDVGLLTRQADAFRRNRSEFQITEPLIRFYHGIVRPFWEQLERPGNAERVWNANRQRFASNILGPHFEQLCREWTLYHADPEMLGGMPAQVGSGVITENAARTSHEVDVAAIGVGDTGRPALLAIGEAKVNKVMGGEHVERLRHIREVIAGTGRFDTTHTRLMLFSGAGFKPRAEQAAHSPDDVHLLGLPDLYS